MTSVECFVGLEGGQVASMADASQAESPLRGIGLLMAL